MFLSFTYSPAVILLVMLLRPSVTQDLSDSSVTVELLDNRSTYCPGETARIRCNIAGSDNDSSIVFDWLIDGIDYTPATIAQHVPGHTTSSSDPFALQVTQTKAYRANYRCSRRSLTGAINSKAKLLTFGGTNLLAPTVTCTNTTSNSVIVVVRDTSSCIAAKLEVAIIGRSNCFTTGHELYLCAGLQVQTTYNISAVATTRSSNGSVLATAMGSAVCTTAAGTVTETILSIKGNDGGVVEALAALFTVSFLIVLCLLSTLLICTVINRNLKRKLHSQGVTAAMAFSKTSIPIRGGEEGSAVNETPGPLSKEEEVAEKDKKESDTVRGMVYADLDFAGRAQPIKPPPAFEKVQYADVS